MAYRPGLRKIFCNLYRSGIVPYCVFLDFNIYYTRKFLILQRNTNSGCGSSEVQFGIQIWDQIWESDFGSDLGSDVGSDVGSALGFRFGRGFGLCGLVAPCGCLTCVCLTRAPLLCHSSNGRVDSMHPHNWALIDQVAASTSPVTPRFGF